MVPILEQTITLCPAYNDGIIVCRSIIVRNDWIITRHSRIAAHRG